MLHDTMQNDQNGPGPVQTIENIPSFPMVVENRRVFLQQKRSND